ncbi:hypothetical protein [Aeoliella mucimassa]|uniref:Uncharacterized protein n=1 Tax=Aeoliella mucimassa TaxID=2527972 RepID=A0A518ASV2_9BACT|nr:hypothetical protein [Aeoliella mucimassa]QDU57802.1 hypothetical protein Pan181_40250 [Aeoliella mucimassa]
MINGVHIASRTADQTLAVLELTPVIDPPLGDGMVVVGAVRGPYSERSHTLPAEFPLADADDGKLVARIVDPCYATDDLPMEYVVELYAKQGAETLGEYKTRVTLRAK